MDYVPLCDPWPVSCVTWDGVSPAATGKAVEAASEWLWALSGRQFGSCPVVLRPCRKTCNTGGGWWWDGWSWPADTYGPGWLAAVCGRCSGNCGCNGADMLRLDYPVQEIREIVINGSALPASGYALYDGDTLVRTDGGLWPLCQDWTVPVSGTGAWHIEAVYGAPVPALGELAMGEAAREFGLACTAGAVCKLPSGVTSIVRNGVTQNLASAAELKTAGSTGLSVVDRFLDAVNPHGIRQRVQIWNPDDFATPRQPGAAGWW
jgi:hypothetical protein